VKPNPAQKFQVRLLKIAEISAAVDLLGGQLREHGVKTDLGKVRSIIERIVEDDRLGFVLVALEKNERPVGVALGCAFLGIEHSGISSQDRDHLIPRMKRFMRGTVKTANHELLMDNMLRLRSKKWHACCNRCLQPQNDF
jgi:hypothetical protein